MPACEAAFAIPTYLAAIADALKCLCLSLAVGALAVASTNLPGLLAELAAGGAPRFRTVACPQSAMPLRALPVAYLPLGRAVAAFRPDVGALEITSDSLGTSMCQLLLRTFGPRKASRASPPVLIVRLNFCWLTESRYCTPLRCSTLCSHEPLVMFVRLKLL